MCAARPPGLQDLLGILHRWLKSQLSLKQRPTLRFNLKGVSNTVTGLQKSSQTETRRHLLGNQLLRPPVLMISTPINFSKKETSGQTPQWVLYKNMLQSCFIYLVMLWLKAGGCSLVFYVAQMQGKSLMITPAHSLRRARRFHSSEALCKLCCALTDDLHLLWLPP